MSCYAPRIRHGRKPTKVRPFRIESLAQLDILSVAYERGNFCTCRASCWSSACGQGRPAHTSMRCFARSCPSSERRLVPGGNSKDKGECPTAVHVRDPLGHSRDESRERLGAMSDTVTLPTKSTPDNAILVRSTDLHPHIAPQFRRHKPHDGITAAHMHHHTPRPGTRRQVRSMCRPLHPAKSRPSASGTGIGQREGRQTGEISRPRSK